MQKQVLILTEAGENIGFGHYTRCFAIQEYILEQKMSCKMLLHLRGNYDLKVLNGIFLDWQNTPNLVQEYASEYTTVLIDSYLAPKEYYSFLSKNFTEVIVIDDYNRISYDANVLINPNVSAPEIDYSNQTAQIYGGKDFVILRKVFRDTIHQQAPKSKIENILITIGGSDFRNILPNLIRLTSKHQAKTSVISGNIDLQQTLQNQFPQARILGLLSANEMFYEFQKADLVISACGQTLHELASIGKPTIGICLDIDQEPNQKFYLENNFLIKKYDWQCISQILIPETLKYPEKTIQTNGIENIYSLLI